MVTTCDRQKGPGMTGTGLQYEKFLLGMLLLLVAAIAKGVEKEREGGVD